MLDNDEINELEELIHQREIDNAKENLLSFTEKTMPEFKVVPFHRSYYEILDMFADGIIKRLIVTVPPQHGKSEGSTRRLPAYMLGKNPNLKIAIGSYSTTFARKFNRDNQRIIDDHTYLEIFPETTLNKSNIVTIADQSLRNSEEFEIVGHRGGLKAVGRGGPLTGNAVDVMIMDDLYKDAMEGNSPVIRQTVWDWYTSVVRKRLHNDSQEIIVFTRWHQGDLIGLLEKKDQVITINSLDDVYKLPEGFDGWVKINYEAIKESEPTELDPREKGEPLWPEKHSLKKLLKERDLDPETFNCMNQGNPISQAGLLYVPFETYERLPEFQKIGCYIDTADKGKDYLCGIVYGVPLDHSDNRLYVLDVLYTAEPMEITEGKGAKLLDNNAVNEVDIESNNGGRGWGRAVEKIINPNCSVNSFFQGENKEARIMSNSSAVNRRIVFPNGWASRWPEFYDDLTYYKKLFHANKQDGGPDVLTGILERYDINNTIDIIW